MNTLVDKVVEELKTLPYNCSGGSCSTPYCLSGVPGQQLLRFAGAIPLDDIQLMRQAIEEGCERVDTNECDTFDTNTNIIIALFAGDTAVKISRQSGGSLCSALQKIWNALMNLLPTVSCWSVTLTLHADMGKSSMHCE